MVVDRDGVGSGKQSTQAAVLRRWEVVVERREMGSGSTGFAWSAATSDR